MDMTYELFEWSEQLERDCKSQDEEQARRGEKVDLRKVKNISSFANTKGLT